MVEVRPANAHWEGLRLVVVRFEVVMEVVGIRLELAVVSVEVAILPRFLGHIRQVDDAKDIIEIVLLKS